MPKPPTPADVLTQSAHQLIAGLLSAAAIADGVFLLAGWSMPDIAAFWLLSLYLLLSLLLLPLLLRDNQQAGLKLLAMTLCAASLGARLGTTVAIDPPGLPHLLLMLAALANLNPLPLAIPLTASAGTR